MENKLHLNGISSSVVMDDEYTIYFHYNQLGFWQSNKDQSVEIDCYCGQIYDAFINKIFGSFKEYQSIFENLIIGSLLQD